jgi:hypothetical protein
MGRRIIVEVALVALVAAGCAGTASPGPAGQTTAPTEAATGQATAEATATPLAATFGDAVTVGDWTIVVNGLKQTASTNQFIKPDAGNVFWVLDATVTNNGTEAQSAGFGLTIQDDQDFTHDAEFLGIKEPSLSATVAPGKKTRGYLTFQLAKTAKPTEVIFQPDALDKSQIATIAVPQ